MIQIKNLFKSYTSPTASVSILEDANLTVTSGSFIAIVGASGSGKSTLLRIIAGLDHPDSGSVSIGDTQITKLSDEALAAYRLHNIGIVFQFFNLLPTLTLRENVALPNYLLKKSRKEALQNADRCLADVGIKNLAERKPHEVSGGELQRAAIARALMNQPKIILADEPTGNLDANTGVGVLKLFADLGEAAPLTRIIVTHSREVAAAAEHVFELKDRTLIALAPMR